VHCSTTISGKISSVKFLIGAVAAIGLAPLIVETYSLPLAAFSGISETTPHTNREQNSPYLFGLHACGGELGR